MAMKRIFTYLAGFSLLSITTISCSKEGHDQTSQQRTTSQNVAAQVINAKVPAEQTYVLNLGPESTASIKTQALHYQLSEIATASDGNTIYKYITAKGFSGTDEVTLQQTNKDGGCNNSNHNHANGYAATSLKTIVIKLNVAN
jgi:hypothetical protein